MNKYTYGKLHLPKYMLMVSVSTIQRVSLPELAFVLSLFFLSGVTASQVFSCTLCPFSYTAQIYLHNHIKRIHTVEYMRLLRCGAIRPETLTPFRSSGGSNQHTQKKVTVMSRSTSSKVTHPSSKPGGADGEIRPETLAPASSWSSKLCPVVVLKRLCTHTKSHTETALHTVPHWCTLHKSLAKPVCMALCLCGALTSALSILCFVVSLYPDLTHKKILRYSFDSQLTS